MCHFTIYYSRALSFHIALRIPFTLQYPALLIVKMENQSYTNPFTEDLGLDYLTPQFVHGSNLDDASKNAYLQQLTEIEHRLLTVEPISCDHLDTLNDWRDLSVRFYRQAGIEGEMYDEWLIGLQSAEGYITIEHTNTEMEEMEELEPLSLAELNARHPELNAEVEPLPVEYETDAQTESGRQNFEEWDDFGEPERESR